MESRESAAEVNNPDDIEARLHRFDMEINKVRERIIYLKRGVYDLPNPEEELERMENRFLELGEAFTRLYQQWRESAQAEN